MSRKFDGAGGLQSGYQQAGNAGSPPLPDILTQIDPLILTLAVVVTLVGGFVKGAVGFALQMI